MSRPQRVAEVRALLGLLAHRGELLEVAPGLFFAPEVVARARRALLEPLQRGEPFSAAAFATHSAPPASGPSRSWNTSMRRG
ncbi:MAG: hypothetical protein KatS3mg102_1262 [Planctomycetota bacterium]|nr:MAG: hypothetical protein KatS3mg102_1262 [Planctomycetota bacterium]